MKLIVGLGNPGGQYARTRHNVGFMVIDRLTEVFPVSAVQSEAWFHLRQATIQTHRVLLVKPQTYMNRSGVAVWEVVHRYQESPENLIVIYDDLDLNIGRLRIRKHGGHGGHKGIKSIMEHLATNQFIRLRMGIGRPDPATIPEGQSGPETVIEYVLQPFHQDEQPIIEEVIERAVEALALIVDDQIEEAMNRYNRR